MKVLITGGAGFIGTSLFAKLIQSKEVTHITVLDSYVPRDSYLLNYISQENFSLIREDVRNIQKLPIMNPDVVFHLAGVVGFPACDKDPWGAESINIEGTLEISRYCQSVGAHLVFASTSSVYGPSSNVLSEDSPKIETSLYSKTKIIGENIVLESGGLVLRFATLCGVSGKNRDDLLLNNFVRSAVHENLITVFQGNSRRSFLGVSDAANAMFHLAAGRREGIYNIGVDDGNYTKRKLAEMVANQTGAQLLEADYNIDPECRDYVVSYAKLASEGFVSREKIPHIVETLIRYYKATK
jgi:nucleoside-diphosphate-sugar epimerase